MKHLALIDTATGAIIIHEEVPDDKAPLRRTMLALQAELDAVVEKTCFTEAAVMLADWPPAGQEEIEIEQRPYLRALAPVESAPLAQEEE